MKEQDNPLLRDILDQASELPAGERAAFLDRACTADSQLRTEIESLLASLDHHDKFLSQPEISRALPSITPGTGSGLASGEPAAERIGRYKLLQLIGEGGFGTVFMAEQEHPVRRRVALKIIKPGMDSRQVIARFEAERQALAMMEHPNIARVLDVGMTESGRPYFAMELVQGIPIHEYCDRKRLPPRQRIELFIPVCRAVQHAHQKGILHRDLKPSNILVMTCDGRPLPKVIDFGVAKALHQRLTEKTLFTQFGNAIGTPEYMSPEQAEMDVVGTDTRSDIYSLGVLLYELLTGFTPLDRAQLRQASYAQMLQIIREQEPLKPSTHLAHSGEALASISADRGTDAKELMRITAGDLDWVVMKCLEKDRSRRYATAEGLARDLERFLHDEPVEASPPSPTDRVRRFARKHRVGLLVSAGFALLLIVATAFSSWQAVKATRAKTMAVSEKGRADQQAGMATAARESAELNLADALIAQADTLGATNEWRLAKERYRQAAQLLRSNGQSTFRVELALWEANRRSPSALLEFPAHQREVTHLRFFPDGKELATVGADGVAHVWETQTGRLVRSISGLGDLQHLSISPDGRAIAFASTSGGVTVWRTADWTAARAIHGFAGRASAISFSPDGRSLVVGTADPPYELCLFDAASGEIVRRFLGHQAAIRDVAFTPDGTKVLSCDGRPPGNTFGYGIHASLRAWDVDGGTLLWTARADPEDRLIGQLAVSPQGDLVATTSWDGTARVWQTSTGSFDGSFGSTGDHDVQGVAFSRQGVIAVGGPEGSIRLAGRRDAPPTRYGRHHGQFDGHAGDVRTLDFSSDGRVLASGGADGIVRIWPVYGGGESTVFPDFHPGSTVNEVFSLVLSGDGRFALSSTTQDRLVRLWNVATTEELGRRTTAYGHNTSAVFGPQNRTIVLIEQDGRLGIWDNLLQRKLAGFDPPADREFECIALSPDGRTLLAGFGDGDDLAVFDLQEHKLLRHLSLVKPPWTDTSSVDASEKWPDGNRRLGFSPDGTFAVGITERQNLLKVWGTADWREWYSVPVAHPFRIAISSDSRRIACAAQDVEVFDAHSGRLLNRFNNAADSRGAVGFLPDPRYLLALGAPPDSLVLWDLSKNARLRSFDFGMFVFDLAISDDGTLLWSQRLPNGAVNTVQLGWVKVHDALAGRLETTRAQLQDNPSDSQSLATLAEWYSFRGMPDWAVDILGHAGPPLADGPLADLSRHRVKAAVSGTLSTRHDQTAGAAALNVHRLPLSVAIARTSRALERHPSDAALLAERGRFYARGGRFADAASDFSKAVELNAGDVVIWEQLMSLLLENGQSKQYESRRTEALRRFASSATPDAGRIARASLLRQGNPQEINMAASLVDRALDRGSNDAWGWCSKGMADYRCGRDREALQWLDKIDDTQDSQCRAASQLYSAMALRRLGRASDANFAFNRGASMMETVLPKPGKGDLSETSFQDWILCDLAYAEAKALFNPTDATLVVDREVLARSYVRNGEFHARLGRFKQAVAEYRRAVELVPETHEYWHDGLVPLLLQAGDLEGYRRWRSAELRRFSGVAQSNTAHRVAKDAMMMPLDGEDLRLAVELADRSLASNSDSWAAYQTKGMAEYRRGHFKEALPYLIRCRERQKLAQFTAAIEMFVAMCYQQMGDHTQALAARARGMKAMAELPTVQDFDTNFGSSDWILCQVARREADELIDGSSPATKPTSSTRPVAVN